MELIGDTRAGASAQAVPFTEVSQIHALYAAQCPAVSSSLTMTF
jgi:hypothetical protein